MARFIGYHGTKVLDAEAIIKNNFKRPTKVGWLGTGVYFFEGNEEMARNFAIRIHGERIEVLRCEIAVPDEHIFDVTDPLGEDNKRFHAFRKKLIEVLIKKRLDITVKNKNELDGKVFNLICIKYKYKLVRHCTYTYQKEDSKHRLFSRVANGIELCVRENGCIMKKEIV